MVKVFPRKWFLAGLSLLVAFVSWLPLAATARAEMPRAPRYALTDNITSYWRFDEASGNRFDLIGANDLTANTTIASTTGLISNAAYFDNTHKYLSVTDNVATSIGAQSFHIAGWVYVDVMPDIFHDVIIVAKDDYSSREYSLLIYGTGQSFRLTVFDNTGSSGEVNSGTISAGNWYFLDWYYNASNREIGLTVNNGSTVMATLSNDARDGTSHTSFGGVSQDTNRKLNGKLDEWSLWRGRVLTSQERSQLYNSGAGCTYPFTACQTVYEVWNIGNYLKDGNMEDSTVWDNTPWGVWGSGPAFAHSLQNSWTNGGVTPLCGSWFRQYSTSDTGAISDGFGNIIQISSQPFGSLNQKFMWYGGDMYIVFAYMNESGVDINVKLTDPFGQTTTIETLSNTASQWKVYYEKLTDQILGRYSFAIEPTSATFGQDVAIDCVSIGEGWYQPFTYNSTPLTPSPAIEGVLVEKTIGTITDSTSNLLPTLFVGGILSTEKWFLEQTGTRVHTLTTPDGRGYILVPPKTATDLANEHVQKYLESLASKDWIEIRNPNAATQAERYIRGYQDTKAKATTSQNVNMVYTVMANEQAANTAVITAYYTQLIDLVNVETGEVLSAQQIAKKEYQNSLGNEKVGIVTKTYNIPFGKYRVRMNTDNRPSAGEYYLDRICVYPSTWDVALYFPGDCGDPNKTDVQTLDGFLNSIRYALRPSLAYVNAQSTSIAASTSTAQYGTAYALATQAQATQQARAYATQTALVASGNTTRIAQATQAQASALTATPAAAATGTAFVQGWNATNTAIAATRGAQYGNVSTQYAVQTQAQSLNAAQATANAKIQATVGAPATSVARLTSQPAGQATLVQLQTQQAQAQPTVNWYSTQFVATQNAAATAYANNANATTSFNATQSVRVVQTSNAVVTQQANLQATTIALSNLQATIVAQGQTNATTIAQAYPTVQLTLQAQATQQVLAQPPTQPDPGWQASCSIPDNPLNLAWWIDYEVCRVLSWFSWSPVNTQQVTTVQTGFLDYEPFGTIKELQDGYTALQTTLDQYDWSGTGVGNGGVCEGQGLLPGYNFNVADCFIGYIARLDPSSGIFSGNFTLTPSDPVVYSTQCDTNMNQVLGPLATQGMCFIYNTVRDLGFMMWIQLAFDVGMGFLFWKYLQRAWISKATSG